MRRLYFRLLAATINPVALRAARRGHGPFAQLTHFGRSTGRRYETPLILPSADGGFVAELTYGDEVAWYRNLMATGRGEILARGVTHQVVGVDDLPSAQGLAAYPQPQRTVLKVLRRRQFRLLRVADQAAGAEPP